MIYGLELLHSSLRVCSFNASEAQTTVVYTKQLKDAVVVYERVMSTCYDKEISCSESTEYFAELSSVLEETTEENKGLKEVVVNTPVYISIEQRNKLERTFLEAGITVRRFVDNATSAILAHEFAKAVDSEYTALVIAIGSDSHADVGLYTCEDGFIEGKSKASTNLSLDQPGEIKSALNNLLSDAKIEKDKIQEFIITGIDAEEFSKYLQNEFCCETNVVKTEADLVCKGLGVTTAILSGNHKGRLDEILVLETMHTSIGVRVDSNEFARIVSRKTDLPTKCNLVVSTTYDNQTDMLLDLYEGDNSDATRNTFLCQIHISNINPAPKGVPQVKITADIDANGVIEIFTENHETGATKNVKLDHKFQPSFMDLKSPSDVSVFKPPKMTDEELKMFKETMES